MKDGKFLSSSKSMKYKVGDFLRWSSGEIAYISKIDYNLQKYHYQFLNGVTWNYYIRYIDTAPEISQILEQEAKQYKLEAL